VLQRGFGHPGTQGARSGGRLARVQGRLEEADRSLG
jgi:hypothetical protein